MTQKINILFIALAVWSTNVNAAVAAGWCDHDQAKNIHAKLVEVCSPHLSHSCMYNHFKEACDRKPGFHSWNMFASNACYELTLGGYPLECLSTALNLCSLPSIYQAFATVFAYKKGQLSSPQELALQDGARIAEKFAPLTIFLPEYDTVRPADWGSSWAYTGRTAELYNKSLCGGLKPHNSKLFELNTHPSCGHFDPHRFLQKLPQNLPQAPTTHDSSEVSPREKSYHTLMFAFTHFEAEHVRRSAYVWIPALCQQETRELLDRTLASYTDPDKEILQTFSTEAQVLCSSHEQQKNTCKDARIFLSKFLHCNMDDIPEGIEQEFVQEHMELSTDPVLTRAADILRQAADNQEIFVSGSKSQNIINRAKISSIAKEFLKFDGKGKDAAPKTLIRILKEHHVAIHPKRTQILADALWAVKSSSKLAIFKDLLRETWKEAHVRLQLPPTGLSEKTLDSAAQELCSTVWIPDNHQKFINDLWDVFDTYEVNISEHQWSSATRLLRKLPWIQEFEKLSPEKCTDLLVYRQRTTFPEPTLETKVDYYIKFSKNYRERKKADLRKKTT